MGTLAERVIKARTARGYSQTELAKAAGVSSQAVNQWESGETKTIKSGPLHRAASFLRVSPDWLLTGRGEMEGESEEARETEVEPAVHDALRDKAIDMVIASVVYALSKTTPAAAPVFVQALKDLAKAAKPRPLKTNKGVIGLALTVAEPLAQQWEGIDRVELPRAVSQ